MSNFGVLTFHTLFIITKNPAEAGLSDYCLATDNLLANLAISEGSRRAVFFGTSFINNDVATIKISTIHLFDSTLGGLSVFEFYESKALTPAGELVGNNGNLT